VVAERLMWGNVKDGKKAYVSNGGDNTVSVVDTKKAK